MSNYQRKTTPEQVMEVTVTELTKKELKVANEVFEAFKSMWNLNIKERWKVYSRLVQLKLITGDFATRFEANLRRINQPFGTPGRGWSEEDLAAIRELHEKGIR